MLQSLITKLLIIVASLTMVVASANATAKQGLGFEIGVGYPDISIRDSTQNAKYSGISVQANLLFPLLKSGNFSIDLDLIYRYTTGENNASNNTLSEWTHLTTFGSGLRFNYSYLFVGFDYLFTKGKHLRAGSSNQIFDYSINPIQWHLGLVLPISPVISVVAGYSQIFDTNFNIQTDSFTMSEQIYWLRLQIDFGVNFFNLLEPSESFTPTRKDFMSEKFL